MYLNSINPYVGFLMRVSGYKTYDGISQTHEVRSTSHAER